MSQLYNTSTTLHTQTWTKSHITINVQFYFAACYVPAASWSPYGASWYGGCNTWKLQEKDSECLNNSDNFNYPKLNIWQSASYTLMGLVSFLFSGYMGRLSDAYGRKFFFIFFCICKVIGYIPLLIVDNIWYNMALTPIAGLTGGNNSATPIMIAYGADVIPEDERTLAFAIMYFLGGIGLLIGSVAGAVIEIYYGFYWIFVAIVGIWTVLIIFCLIFQYESLKPENRKPFETKCYNPFSPLLKLRAHPVVFWIGILQLFISLPETGVVDMATMIVDDLLGIYFI